MSKPVIILAAGGHSRVLINILQLLKAEIIGITEMDERHSSQLIAGIPVIGADQLIFKYPPNEIELVNGLGRANSSNPRKILYEKFKKAGYSFARIIHPSAIIAGDVELGEGVQIMAGSIIQPGSCIGNNTIINTGVVVDHDVWTGDHVHIAPGATISGGVRIGCGVLIGTGATIIQGISIGDHSLIAAGAVVTCNIEAGITVMGIPARSYERR
ncbi:MAG: acetyltransferase [Syntrophomonadaceae bacterium]|nr:acetyltransferase [Syntrophomonadaceae bacterium]